MCILRRKIRVNKLTDKDTHRPETYEEYLDIAKQLFDAGVDVYFELLDLEEERYESFPILCWDIRENYLNAYFELNDDHIENTREEFLLKAGVIPMFNKGQHLIHEFI